MEEMEEMESTAEVVDSLTCALEIFLL